MDPEMERVTPKTRIADYVWDCGCYIFCGNTIACVTHSPYQGLRKVRDTFVKLEIAGNAAVEAFNNLSWAMRTPAQRRRDTKRFIREEIWKRRHVTPRT